ncbi:MAG: DNA polymerase, partial [Candidatus Komeilibacteria bacterium]
MPKIDLDTAMRAPENIGLDFETTGLNWLVEKPLYLGIANDSFSGYINIQEYSQETLCEFFKDFVKTHRVVLQNAKFDFHFLDKYIPINTLKDITFSDTMLLSQIIDENKSHGLDSITELWLGAENLVNKRRVDSFIVDNKIKRGESWRRIPEELLAARGEEDARNTYILHGILRPKAEQEVYRLEKKLLLVLLRMERTGALMDRQYLLELKEKIEVMIKSIADKYLGINLGSSNQRAEYLFKTLNLKPISFTPKKQQPKTDKESLALLDHPAAKDMMEYLNLSHTLATYVDGFLEKMDANDRLHCNFKQMGARTGRMSCVNPNLQQLPKVGRDGKWIKSAFIGNITTYDYEQMEAVLYAYDNKEERMIRMIENNIDLYQGLAALLYSVPIPSVTKDQRSLCKTIFLGRIYGMGDKKFKIMSNGLDPAPTRSFFGKLKQMQNDIEDQIRKRGYIKTLSGRKRHLTLDDAYKGLNSKIQGSAADIVKMVMVNLPFAIQDKMITQVHDELVFAGLEPKEEKIVEEVMCDFRPYKLKVSHG